MKRIAVFILSMVFLMAGARISFASDWDKAGKILTGIEGLRIFTGGRVDVIGTLIGAGHNKGHASHYPQTHRKHHKRYAKQYSDCANRVWVPHYEWHKKYIPAHEDYDEQLGRIIVEEHYIKFKVETGGHWERTYSCL